MQQTMKHEHESQRLDSENTSSRMWSDLRNDMTYESLRANKRYLENCEAVFSDLIAQYIWSFCCQ